MMMSRYKPEAELYDDEQAYLQLEAELYDDEQVRTGRDLTEERGFLAEPRLELLHFVTFALVLRLTDNA